MPKAIKWILAIIAGLVVIILVAVLVAPLVINLDRYKPRLEAEAAKALGRPVTLGGDIEPSVFPWIGVAVHDLHLGNPPEFEQQDFVSVGLFEIRVKLWPLLFGEYEVKRLVVNDPQIVLIKKKNGRANWEGLGGPAEKAPGPAPQPPSQEGKPLPIKDLEVGEFAITNGSLQYIDRAADTRHEVKDLQLTLADISLNRPIRLDFSAVADGHPVQLTGTLGPMGANPGKEPVALDLTAELLKQVEIQVQGRVENPMDSPQAFLEVQVPPFSPRKVMAALNQPLPIEPADPEALTKVALSMKLSGTPDRVATEGVLTLDQSQMTFDVDAKEFEKPNIQVETVIDRIDVDRYLPPPSEEKDAEEKPAAAPAQPGDAPETAPIDYTPLRKLVLDAQIKVNELKVKNARTRNVVLNATAKNGIIRIDPLNMDLYGGRMSVASTVNVQQQAPRTDMGLSIENVQAGPLLKDVLDKDIIEGALIAAVSLKMAGDQTEQITRTLTGQGDLKFLDGAIVGIDLADMLRNVKASFGLAEKPAQKPRTDFSELVVPFTVTDGLTKLNQARLQSPLLRVTVDGSADLVQETLDIRVEPKFVATLKGQGDVKERAGVMVPVMIGGTFGDPNFKPDLKAIIKQDLPDAEALKKMIPPEEDIKKDLEKKAQDLLDQFAPGMRKKQ